MTAAGPIAGAGRQAALAAETSLFELIYVIGPLLVAALTRARHGYGPAQLVAAARADRQVEGRLRAAREVARALPALRPLPADRRLADHLDGATALVAGTVHGGGRSLRV